jgi:short-subunit dehydrogenase
MANDSATRAYVLTLGETLNFELKKDHVHVTVLLPGPTYTPLAEKMGFDAHSTPLSVEQTVSEGLAALSANHPSHLSGALFRVMDRLMPHSLFRTMNGNMLRKALAQKRQASPVVLTSGPQQK